MSIKTEAMTDEGAALRETARSWLARIEEAEKREKTWRDDAAKAVRAYTGEGERSEAGEAELGVVYDFNILHANVETIVPAVINSPPAPDVRRRFGAADPVARDFAELLERSMRVQIDDGRLQTEMEAMAQDGFLAGRGMIRVRFKSDFIGGETRTQELEALERADEAGTAPEPEAAPERTANERVCFEAVSWRNAVHGPATRWSDVQWWAFKHAMQREDIDGFADAALVTSQGPDEREEGEPDADRTVWEIWDKRSRTVMFVSERSGIVIKQVPDPLGLSNFFPIATPVQPIEVTNRLMPVNPFSIYRRLADELDTTTKRIRVLTTQLKMKGWYGTEPSELEALLAADDNEFVPIADKEVWASNGGLQGAIAFWPVDKLIQVLRELYALRDQTKQSIYEITGISDIVRGASKSGETLGAQQIKTQWGSLRIQKFQRMMERAAREIFLMMAEIIPTKFSADTLFRMTEIQVEPTHADMQPVPPPPQVPQGMQPDQQQAQALQQAAQQAQEAEQKRQGKIQHLMQLRALMREPAASYFRVDVETDSTVRADLTRQKEEATGFMGAASQYFTAVAPLVQQGALPMEVAVEIFGSFSRLFNLGKSVEDALSEMVDTAKERAGQPPQPDPAAEAAKADAAAKAKAAEVDIALKQQEGTLRQQEAEATQAVRGVELQIKQTELQARQLELFAKRQEAMTLIPGMGQPASNPGGFANV